MLPAAAGTPIPRKASNRSSLPRALTAFAASKRLAPTAAKAAARSNTATSNPALRSASAAVNPPMPPPATINLSEPFMFHPRATPVVV
jgi:hypothetical protein